MGQLKKRLTTIMNVTKERLTKYLDVFIMTVIGTGVPAMVASVVYTAIAVTGLSVKVEQLSKDVNDATDVQKQATQVQKDLTERIEKAETLVSGIKKTQNAQTEILSDLPDMKTAIDEIRDLVKQQQEKK